MTFRASRTKLLFIGMAVFREERGLPRRQCLKSRQTLDYLTLVYFSARARARAHVSVFIMRLLETVYRSPYFLLHFRRCISH